jgi:hypothetical protein
MSLMGNHSRSVKGFAAAGAKTDGMAILQALSANPDAFTTLLTEKHDVGKMNGPFPLYDPTLLLATGRFLVAFDEVHLFHNHPVLFPQDTKDLALFTLFFTRRNDDEVVPFDSDPSHGSLLEDLGCE